MRAEATTRGPLETDADAIAIGVIDGEPIPHDLPGGELNASVAAGEARADPGHVAVVHAAGRRFLLTGLGLRTELDPERARVAAAHAAARAGELAVRTLAWELPHHVDDAIAAALVHGTGLRAYRFDRYRPAGASARLERLLVSAHHDVSAPVAMAGTLVAAQNRARDLANTPANDLTPAALADYTVGLADTHSTLSASVRDEEQIAAAGMGAFASVARGSREPARLIELRYEPPGASGPLVGIVGKAVTFDSGGLSLKSRNTMFEMKFDMAGGAAVIEAIAALAELGAPARVLGIVGATENLPGGSATRPGDIVRAADGTTIEVNNTDAEGRLVLADCLLHARSLGVERLVDIATLTGGVLTALGSVHAGLFASDEELASVVEAAAAVAGEPVWRLPLHPGYAAMVRGRYAQLTNLTERREAQASTAAEFLHRFAGTVPWAHLDIAGMAYDVPSPYLVGKGATGFGVRLLAELAMSLAGA